MWTLMKKSFQLMDTGSKLNTSSSRPFLRAIILKFSVLESTNLKTIKNYTSRLVRY
ncbi:hypothetical protein KSS87_000765, partial [Heliosperma pusillum]